MEVTYSERSFAAALITVGKNDNSQSHRWKDHCTAGIQFSKTGFAQKRTCVVISID